MSFHSEGKPSTQRSEAIATNVAKIRRLPTLCAVAFPINSRTSSRFPFKNSRNLPALPHRGSPITSNLRLPGRIGGEGGIRNRVEISKTLDLFGFLKIRHATRCKGNLLRAWEIVGNRWSVGKFPRERVETSRTNSGFSPNQGKGFAPFGQLLKFDCKIF